MSKKCCPDNVITTVHLAKAFLCLMGALAILAIEVAVYNLGYSEGFSKGVAAEYACRQVDRTSFYSEYSGRCL